MNAPRARISRVTSTATTLDTEWTISLTRDLTVAAAWADTDQEPAASDLPTDVLITLIAWAGEGLGYAPEQITATLIQSGRAPK